MKGYQWFRKRWWQRRMWQVVLVFEGIGVVMAGWLFLLWVTWTVMQYLTPVK